MLVCVGAGGLGAVLFLFWNVGAPRDVVHTTSGLWAWFSLGSQHLVRAGGSSKKKQVMVLGNSTAGFGCCVEDSTSNHLPSIPTLPSFPAFPAHLEGLLKGSWAPAEQDGALH